MLCSAWCGHSLVWNPVTLQSSTNQRVLKKKKSDTPYNSLKCKYHKSVLRKKQVEQITAEQLYLQLFKAFVQLPCNNWHSGLQKSVVHASNPTTFCLKVPQTWFCFCCSKRCDSLSLTSCSAEVHHGSLLRPIWVHFVADNSSHGSHQAHHLAAQYWWGMAHIRPFMGRLILSCCSTWIIFYLKSIVGFIYY